MTAFFDADTRRTIEQQLSDTKCVAFMQKDASHLPPVLCIERVHSADAFEAHLRRRALVAKLVDGVLQVFPDPDPSDAVLALRWIGDWSAGQAPFEGQYSWFDHDYLLFWRADVKHIEELGARLRAGTAPESYSAWRAEVRNHLTPHW